MKNSSNKFLVIAVTLLLIVNIALVAFMVMGKNKKPQQSSRDGKAAFENPMYWFALVIAMIAGFLVPLPYNYYKLKKFNKACH